MDEIVSTHARKSRVAEIKRDIRTIDETVGREQWRFGTVLHEVVRDALFREDGCETFGDWLETEDVGISPSSARRAMLLAAHFTEEMAARFGGRKLNAVLNYMELTARDEQPGDALALTFRERQPNGRFKSVPFIEASARRIEKACTDLRHSRLGHQERALLGHKDPEIRKQAADAQAAAKTVNEAVKGSKVKFKRRASDGEMVWRFGDIRQSAIPALIAALQLALVKAGG